MRQGDQTGVDLVILVVCSGNICRSPIAQQLLRSRLAALPGRFDVLSAGTVAAKGQAMTDEAAEMSRRLNGNPTNHVSTPLTAALIERADLVLTATREHRAAVVSLVARSSRRTFTLRQFARLADALESTDVEALAHPRDVVKAVAAHRGFIPPPEVPDDDDIADPYLEPIEVYEEVAAEIDEAVNSLVSLFATVQARSGT